MIKFKVIKLNGCSINHLVITYQLQKALVRLVLLNDYIILNFKQNLEQTYVTLKKVKLLCSTLVLKFAALYFYLEN